jgi:hypothetical protein
MLRLSNGAREVVRFANFRNGIRCRLRGALSRDGAQPNRDASDEKQEHKERNRASTQDKALLRIHGA